MTSFRIAVSPLRRQYANLLECVRDALMQAYDEENRKRGLRKTEIARSLGRSKGFITRKLNRAENMTLLTLSNLAHEMGRDVEISLPHQDRKESVINLSERRNVLSTEDDDYRKSFSHQTSIVTNTTSEDGKVKVS